MSQTITIQNESAMSWKEAVVTHFNVLPHLPAKAMESLEMGEQNCV